MRFPRVMPLHVLLGALVALLIGSMVNNRESLRFCEKALFGETTALEKGKALKAPVRFTEVCPDVRERVEHNINKWLEVILALMVQFSHPQDPP